jgi:hypothetical protein
MKTITRTVESSIIYSSRIHVTDGQVTLEELQPLTVNHEKVNEEKALNVVKKFYGKKDAYAITKIVYDAVKYSMSLTDFIANAEIVE